MNPRNPNENAEVDALFQAARQLETSSRGQRAEISRIEAELEAQRKRHAAELEQSKNQVRQLAARDQALVQQLGATKTQLQNYMTHYTRLQQAHAKLSSDIKEHLRKRDLELVAARSSFDHMRAKAQELEQSKAQTQPEIERLRAELEQAQGEVLDREHRYQASTLTYQGYNRQQQDAIQAFKDQLKRVQDELGQYKSRWLETERLRQEADRMRQEAQREAGEAAALSTKLRELEEANRSLSQRLEIEKRRREQDSKIGPALQEAEARLARNEAELSRAKAEAALLRASRSFQPKPAKSTPTFDSVDPEILEKLALTSYPVRSPTRS